MRTVWISVIAILLDFTVGCGVAGLVRDRKETPIGEFSATTGLHDLMAKDGASSGGASSASDPSVPNPGPQSGGGTAYQDGSLVTGNEAGNPYDDHRSDTNQKVWTGNSVLTALQNNFPPSGHMILKVGSTTSNFTVTATGLVYTNHSYNKVTLPNPPVSLIPGIGVAVEFRKPLAAGVYYLSYSDGANIRDTLTFISTPCDFTRNGVVDSEDENLFVNVLIGGVIHLFNLANPAVGTFLMDTNHDGDVDQTDIPGVEQCLNLNRNFDARNAF
jgi:hypothetical protein